MLAAPLSARDREQAQDVRHEESHEADETGGGHGHAGEERPDHKGVAPHPLHVDAELERAVLAQAQRVVVAAHHEQCRGAAAASTPSTAMAG
jgi:hypothetical protein